MSIKSQVWVSENFKRVPQPPKPVNKLIYPITRYAIKTPAQIRFDRVRGRVLCIAGPPGVGKSRLCRSLAEHLSADGIRSKYFPEKVNRDHLAIYLDDKAGEAHAFQDCMVQRRIATYEEACLYAEHGGFAVVDGPITTDNVFELWNYEMGYIDEKHHVLYCNTLREVSELNEPDWVVYLDGSPETNVRRLASRRNFAEITTYTHEYYAKYRELNIIVVGDSRIATIPYDIDYSIDENGLLDKEASYSILDDIINRKYEGNGLKTSSTTA